MKTKLIFIIDSSFPYVSGGRETWLYEHCVRLMEKYDITIVAMKRRKRNKVQIHPIPTKIKLVSIPTLYNIPIGGRFWYIKYLWGGHFLFSILSSIYLISRFFLNNDKIVFISLNQGQTFVPSFFVRGNNVRRICAVHGPYVDEMSEAFPTFRYIFKFLEKFSFKHADMILLNGFDTEKAIRNKIKTQNKVKILLNGVCYDKFINSKKIEKRTFKKITMVATLSDRRGTHYLIQAISYILNKCNNFKVCFVGNGDINYYYNKAKDLGVEEYVEFMGERKDIPEILANSDIVACLTDGLGISLSMLEAMASGKTIIAWNNLTYSQILKHNYSGYLVNTFDSLSLGEGLVHLLENPDLCRNLGINAQKEAEKFDWGMRSLELSSHIDELL